LRPNVHHNQTVPAPADGLDAVVTEHFAQASDVKPESAAVDRNNLAKPEQRVRSYRLLGLVPSERLREARVYVLLPLSQKVAGF
jgi:hypothetical protein